MTRLYAMKVGGGESYQLSTRHTAALLKGQRHDEPNYRIFAPSASPRSLCRLLTATGGRQNAVRRREARKGDAPCFGWPRRDWGMDSSGISWDARIHPKGSAKASNPRRAGECGFFRKEGSKSPRATSTAIPTATGGSNRACQDRVKVKR